MKQLLIFIFLCTGMAQAQDLMYLRGQKQPLKVKVTELGLDEIKYRYWPVDTSSPVQVIAKDNVSKVVLEKGDAYSFAESGMAGKANYANQRKNAFKVAFLSPLFGHTAISYERSIRPGRSYEVGVGIIGAGRQMGGVDYSYDKKSAGVFGRIGYKFMSSPDFYLRGMRYAHVLKGFYAKPEAVLGYYNVDFRFNDLYYYYGGYGGSAFDYPDRKVTFGAAMINIGKQWVFDDVFLLDMYLGLGYGFSIYNKNDGVAGWRGDSPTPEIHHFAFLGADQDFPLAASAGIKIGFLTGKKGTKTPETQKFD